MVAGKYIVFSFILAVGDGLGTLHARNWIDHVRTTCVFLIVVVYCVRSMFIGTLLYVPA